MVAVLRTIDEDRWQNHSYNVIPNALFGIEGDRLKTLVRFNYEVQNSYHLNITTTDSGNDSLTQGVVVSVLDVNDAPSGIMLPQGTEIAENTKVGGFTCFSILRRFPQEQSKTLVKIGVGMACS